MDNHDSPKQFIFYIDPRTYEDYLITSRGITKAQAKKIVDELYKKQYGISREEHASYKLWEGNNLPIKFFKE